SQNRLSHVFFYVFPIRLPGFFREIPGPVQTIESQPRHKLRLFLHLHMREKTVILSKIKIRPLETVTVHMAAAVHLPHDNAGRRILHGFLKKFRKYKAGAKFPLRIPKGDDERLAQFRKDLLQAGLWPSHQADIQLLKTAAARKYPGSP